MFRSLMRDEGSCSSNFPHPGRIACCPAPDRRPPATKELHTIYGNSTIIVSSSWWWAYKCPKRVEQIKSATKHSVASSWFFLYAYTTMHGQTDTSDSLIRRGNINQITRRIKFAVCLISQGTSAPTIFWLPSVHSPAFTIVDVTLSVSRRSCWNLRKTFTPLEVTDRLG